MVAPPGRGAAIPCVAGRLRRGLLAERALQDRVLVGVRPTGTGTAVSLELMLLGYAIAVGLAAAGIATSLRELVTARPAAFAVPGGTYPKVLVGLAAIALTGPILVLRAGWRAWVVDGRPVRWLALAGTVAFLWSGCTGVLILDVALGLRHSLS